jgi:GAF domain-containing protein
MRYILTEYRVDTDHEGNPSVAHGSHLDITQRKKAEDALAKRATEMAAVANISTEVSSLREPAQILQTVVDQTKENFNLYHTHIYLLNESGDELDLTVGAGEIGQQMVDQGWRIPIDNQHSLVARAARTHQGVIVNDVRSEPDFMPNELLPETRSELAIPLIIGNRVLGVLDVQSDEQDHFSQEDVYIQTTLASQVAIALENARTFIQTQRQAEFEAMINAISQKIQSTTSIDNALQVAVRELGRALGSKRTSVHLSIGENDQIKAGTRSDGN